MTKIQNWMLMVFLSLSMSVWAEVFECKDAQGHIKYQDSECYQTNDTQVINLPSGTFVKHSRQESISQIISYDTAMTAENYKLGLEAYQQQDYLKAFKLISVAANSQHPEAQNMLGEMYLDGQGISKNESIACGWFKRSADLGYVTAQTNLAYSYNEGRGCPKDVYLAKFWYQKAIKNGDSRAKKLLAELAVQEAINVEKMQAEAQRYQSLSEKINHPSPPPVETSSAGSVISWLIVVLLLAFIMLLRGRRIEKGNSAKFINNLKNPNPIIVKTSSVAHAESKENQEAINQNHQQKDLSESEKKELLQSAIKWIEAERYKKQSLPSDNSTLHEDVESYETYQQDSPNTRQFKSLLRAIKEQKKTDPLIGAKVGAKEIIQQLLHLLRDNKGVHAESMLAVLGTLAGYACQASVRQEFVANQKLPEQGIFMVAKDADGRCYYFGDYLNKPLCSGILKLATY
jgi:TPR repeat protein